MDIWMAGRESDDNSIRLSPTVNSPSSITPQQATHTVFLAPVEEGWLTDRRPAITSSDEVVSLLNVNFPH